MHRSALTCLYAWGRHQPKAGRRLLFRGDKGTQHNLAQLDLHEHLGLAYQKVDTHGIHGERAALTGDGYGY